MTCEQPLNDIVHGCVIGECFTLNGSAEVAELSADDSGINHLPPVVTDCSPRLIKAYLYTTFVGCQPIHQS